MDTLAPDIRIKRCKKKKKKKKWTKETATAEWQRRHNAVEWERARHQAAVCCDPDRRKKCCGAMCLKRYPVRFKKQDDD